MGSFQIFKYYSSISVYFSYSYLSLFLNLRLVLYLWDKFLGVVQRTVKNFETYCQTAIETVCTNLNSYYQYTNFSYFDIFFPVSNISNFLTFAYLFDKISFCCFDLHLQNSRWGRVSSHIFQVICILSFSENSLFVWLLALSLFFFNLGKLFELRKLTLYLSCLLWIFSPTCYLPLTFGYGCFGLFVPYKCFKVFRCKILVSFMAVGCTVCWMSVFLAGNPDLGFERENHLSY